MRQSIVIVMFDIAFTENLKSVSQTFVAEIITGVKSFEKNRIIVFQQILYQILVFSSIYVVWQICKIGQKSGSSFIIMHFVAYLFQFRSSWSFIFETMQNDFYTTFVQSFHFIIYVEHSAIVGRPWNIQRYNVQIFIHSFSFELVR